ARAGGIRGALGGGGWPHARSGAAALLRRARGRQDGRHHADRVARLSRRPDPRPADGDLRPPAPLSLSAARHAARLDRRALNVQLAIETLLDGVMQTLRDAVLPAVQGRFARGQLFAVLDVLQNLRDRVEPKAALDEAEASSASGALERALEALGSDAEPVAGALAEV